MFLQGVLRRRLSQTPDASAPRTDPPQCGGPFSTGRRVGAYPVYKKVSNYQAEVDGNIISLESRHVHSKTAQLCVVRKVSTGELVTRYINSTRGGMICPQGYTITAYPARLVASKREWQRTHYGWKDAAE